MIYPLLNFLNGGRMTVFCETMQCRPIRTLARSPRMMQSDMIIVCQKETIKVHAALQSLWKPVYELPAIWDHTVLPAT